MLESLVLGSYVHGERTPLSQGALIRTEPIPYKNILNVAFVFCHSGFTKSLLYRAPPRCLLIYIQAFPSREAKCQEERLKGCREAEGCPEAEPEVFRSRHPRQYQSSHMQASRVRACWSPWCLVLGSNFTRMFERSIRVLPFRIYGNSSLGVAPRCLHIIYNPFRREKRQMSRRVS
jgi:hypothetical protein